MNRILFFVLLVAFSLQSCLKQDTVTYQAQLKSDTTSISAFVKTNNPEAIKVKTGFWYFIDTVGLGVYPVLSDSVTLSYTAKLIPHLTEVDHVDSTTVLLSATISGFQQGLILFPANSVGKLYLPSGLAFGTSTHKTKVPPNANLLYEIKVIRVKGTRLTSDIAAIDTYLQTNSIIAQRDTTSGIRYTIDEIDSTAMTPPLPLLADSILVTYSTRILTNADLVESVITPTPVALKDQVTAWKIMLPQYVAEGSKITMYVPSGFAYGSSVSETIPANSNLIYRVNLIKVIHH